MFKEAYLNSQSSGDLNNKEESRSSTIACEKLHIEDGPRPGDRYILKYGAKQLTIYVDPIYDYLAVDTYVENIAEAERLPEETSLLYQKASEIFQELATSQQIRVNYIFKTKYSQLMQWATSKGQDIFRWDRVNDIEKFGVNGELLSDDNRFEAEKNYLPVVKT